MYSREEALWEKYHKLVYYQAYKYSRKYSWVGVEEFEGLAMYGFAKCINTYDEITDSLLRTCMINEIRSFFQRSESTYKKDLATTTWLREREQNTMTCISHMNEHVAHVFEKTDLTVRERQVLVSVVYKEKTRTATAKDLGISSPRADQLYNAAVSKVRKQLNGTM